VHYIFLTFAILSETTATLALQASRQFTNPLPSVIVVIGYAASFYFLALTIRVLPIGIVYAVWSGVGIALIAGLGAVLFNQKLDFAAIAGIGFILVGIVIIQLFSETARFD